MPPRSRSAEAVEALISTFVDRDASLTGEQRIAPPKLTLSGVIPEHWPSRAAPLADYLRDSADVLGESL